MKRFLRGILVVLALSMTLSGCGGDKEKNTEVESTQSVLKPKLDALGTEISYLEEKAETLYEEGKLDEEKYNTVMGLMSRFQEIGSEDTQENELKYNELKKLVDDLKYDLSAAEDPVATDEQTALTSLMDSINEVEPVLMTANEKGIFPDERLELFNEYRLEVQGYIDGTREKGDNLTLRLSEIRSDITTMASQAEASNETIDNLLAQPVTVEDNTKLEELISNYLELQEEVSQKVENNELDESKLTELITIGIDVANVKEALQTGNITEETKQTMEKCNTELKAFAEGIGSPTAENFNN